VTAEPLGAVEPASIAAAEGDAGPGVERSPRAAALDLSIAAGLWGGLYVVSAATFDAIPPITLNVLRLVVGVAVLAVVFRGDLGIGRASGRRVLAAGVIVAVTMALQFVGTSLTGAAEGALLTTTTPAFVLLLGVALERQRVGRVAWFGVAIALVGVAAIAARGRGFGGFGGPEILGVPASLAGDLLLVGAAATWALFSHAGKPLVAQVGAFRAILQASSVGILLLLPFVPLELSRTPIANVTLPTVLAVLYLGVMATSVAWSLWYRGYAATPATVSAAAFFAQPVVGAVLGVALLGERLDALFLFGAGAIVAGVLAIVVGGRSEA
jgi:drug/metabolite transporter (DMT)-like permease